MMSFSESVKTCLTKKYATISGRATRAEYWWFQLFIYMITFLLVFMGSILNSTLGRVIIVIGFIFFIGTIIPSFCARIRRLHDAGHSGWYILWSLLPYVGSLIVLIAELQSSDDDNEYGPCPFFLED